MTSPQPPLPESSTAALPKPADTSGVLAAAIRLISGLTLLSRFSGLARDILTARVFGDGLLGSSFRAAYAAPNLFRRLFGEGALSAAFMPEYTRILKTNRGVADSLASLVVYTLCAVTSLIVIVLELVLLIIVSQSDNPERNLSLQLIMVMLPMMPAVCLTAILGGVLQVHGKFGPPAAAPILLNIAQIIAALVCVGLHISPNTGTYVVGWSAVGASVLQIIWCIVALNGRVHWNRSFSLARTSARTVLSRFVPVVIGLGTLQLNTMLDTLIAMWPTWIGPTMFGFAVTLDQSSNAVLSYAQTVYQFPLGVFGIAVATAIFPLLSRTAGDPAAFLDCLRRGLRLSLFIGLPASIGLFLVREDLVRTLFGGTSEPGAVMRGFTEANLARAAAALAGFSPAVWAYSLNHVFSRAFYAKGDTTTPMRVAICMVFFNLILNFILIWPLKEAGLAWATAISASVQSAVLLLLCSRRIASPIIDSETARGGIRTAVSSVVMGAAVWAVVHFLPTSPTWLGGVYRLATSVIVGAAVFAALGLLLRSPELRWLRQRGPKGGSGAAESMSFE